MQAMHLAQQLLLILGLLLPSPASGASFRLMSANNSDQKCDAVDVSCCSTKTRQNCFFPTNATFTVHENGHTFSATVCPASDGWEALITTDWGYFTNEHLVVKLLADEEHLV
ncbi:unnamed protein product [Symbiodinium microadriaticum]|nr:unnamed protein product [Symbiodinium microadriaticum]CAE7946752.1 unnamed protein product [Symbiodinium sp. KB8]